VFVFGRVKLIDLAPGHQLQVEDGRLLSFGQELNREIVAGGHKPGGELSG
jgi:hypothetical protein